MKVEKPDQLDAVPKVVSLETRKGAKELIFCSGDFAVTHIVSVSPETLRPTFLNLAFGKMDSESLTIRMLDLAAHTNAIAEYYDIRLTEPYTATSIRLQLVTKGLEPNSPKLVVTDTHATWDGVEAFVNMLHPIVSRCLISELEGLAHSKLKKYSRPFIENVRVFDRLITGGSITDELYSYPSIESATFLNGDIAMSSLWLTALLQAVMKREGYGKTVDHAGVIQCCRETFSWLKTTGKASESDGVNFIRSIRNENFYCVVESEYVSINNCMEDMLYLSSELAILVSLQYSHEIRCGVYETMQKRQRLLDMVYNPKNIKQETNEDLPVGTCVKPYNVSSPLCLNNKDFEVSQIVSVNPENLDELLCKVNARIKAKMSTSHLALQNATFLNGEVAIPTLYLTWLIQELIDDKNGNIRAAHKTVMHSCRKIYDRLLSEGKVFASNGETLSTISKDYWTGPMDPSFYCMVETDYKSSRGRMENILYVSEDLMNLVIPNFLRQVNKSDRLYIIHAVNTDHYKVGVTNRMDKRLIGLTRQNANELDLLFCEKVTFPFKTESAILDKFKATRMNGEWFKATNEEIKTLIEDLEDEIETNDL